MTGIKRVAAVRRSPSAVRSYLRRLPHPDAPAVDPTALARHWEEREWFYCWYCDRPFSEAEPAQADHVIPTSRGGADAVGNLVPVCWRCNVTKSDGPAYAYLRAVLNDHGHGPEPRLSVQR